MITDDEARANISANVQRLLSVHGQSVYWLMKRLSMSPGAIYPIVRGDVLPSIAMGARIAEAVGATVEDLLQPPPVRRRKKSA